MLDHASDLLTTLHAIAADSVRSFVPPTGAAPTATEPEGSRPASRHEKDEDCDVDPATDSCRECGVWHGAPCLICAGAGFHRDYCPEFER